MQITANSVKLLTGGNVIKQGDQTPITFELIDETGNLVNLEGSTVIVKIANPQILVLEKNATINEDNTISIALSQSDITGHGVMRLEFHVTYPDQQKEIFPADGWQEIKITPSLDVLDNGNVSVITIEQFEQRINTAVTEANTATTAANNAANTANQVAQDVSEATTAANNAASNANTAANAANTAAISANDAAAAANASAGEAETAATNATNASDAANTASNAANLASIAASDAADIANTAASNADAATNSATTAAENANTATTAANNAAVNTQAIVDNTKFIEIYNPLTQYKKNNIVSLNGSSFIAKRDTMGNTPIGDASDLNWGLIAQRGVDGTGSVSTVNNIPPDENGNVEITIPDPDLSGYETVTGAQEKADAAEANAIAWGKSYGLGTVSKTLSSVDLDGVAENGLYYASAVANRPITENGYLIVQVLSGVYSSQKYITATTNREFRRINNNGTWSAWEEIIGSEEFTQFQDEVTSHLAEKASKTEFGHVMVGDGLTVNNGVISANIPELEASNVTTTQGTTVQTELDSLKSSVSNGKVDVRNAITGKGGTVADADGDGIPTHAELVAGVNGIPAVNNADMVIDLKNIVNTTFLEKGVYHDEPDNIVVVAYENQTGGDYRIRGYNRSGFQEFQTGSNLNTFTQGFNRDNDSFYRTSGTSLQRFPIATGAVNVSQVWQYIHPSINLLHMFSHNGKIYVSRNNTSVHYFVIDKVTGQLLDQHDLGIMGYGGNYIAIMEMDEEGFLYLYCADKNLYKVNPATKSIVWMVTGLTFNSGNPYHLHITGDKKSIIAQTNNRYATMIDLETGAIKGTKNTLLSNPYISSDEYGNLFTFANDNIQFLKDRDTLSSANTGKKNQTGLTGFNIKGLGIKYPFSLYGTYLGAAGLYYKNV